MGWGIQLPVMTLQTLKATPNPAIVWPNLHTTLHWRLLGLHTAAPLSTKMGEHPDERTSLIFKVVFPDEFCLLFIKVNIIKYIMVYIFKFLFQFIHIWYIFSIVLRYMNAKSFSACFYLSKVIYKSSNKVVSC